MDIKRGLSQKNIEELINYANSDEGVKKFTSDSKRFKDKASFEAWLKKGREIYSLVNEDGELMGVCWFGAEGEGFTLAIRIYGEARGKGLGYGFLKETMNSFMKLDEYQNADNKGWWLETSKDNIAALKIYEKLGFVFERDGEDIGKSIYRRRPGFVS